MKINDFFEECYCINLDRRKDRWESCSRQFKKHNIEVKRFTAIDGNEMREKREEWPEGADDYGVKDILVGNRRWDRKSWGAAALSATYNHLIKEAKEKSLDSIMVFEDDVLFVDTFEKDFFEMSKKIPQDWDILYLGGNNEGGLGEQIFDRLYRCKWTLTTHAIGIHSKMYDRILGNNDVFGSFIDVTIADMHHGIKAYVFCPFLATQAVSYSDIEYREQNNQGFIG